MDTQTEQMTTTLLQEIAKQCKMKNFGLVYIPESDYSFMNFPFCMSFNMYDAEDSFICGFMFPGATFDTNDYLLCINVQGDIVYSKYSDVIKDESGADNFLQFVKCINTLMGSTVQLSNNDNYTPEHFTIYVKNNTIKS